MRLEHGIVLFTFAVVSSNRVQMPDLSSASVCRPWRCHGTDNRSLINNLYAGHIIQSKEVRDTLYQVDRGHYVPSDQIISAYDEAPLGIGFGQTISTPHMHVKAMEELLPVIETSHRTHPIHILDVGSGSGYLSAAFGRLFHVLDIPEGTVYGIDSIQEGLVDVLSNANI
eukprot:scaffold610634_cov83-Attheya_sp.AAC.1